MASEVDKLNLALVDILTNFVVKMCLASVTGSWLRKLSDLVLGHAVEDIVKQHFCWLKIIP